MPTKKTTKKKTAKTASGRKSAAKANTSGKTSGKQKKAKKRGFSFEIKSVVFACVGLLLALSMFLPSLAGVLGGAVHDFLLGVFGLPAFLLPILLTVYGLHRVFTREASFGITYPVLGGIFLVLSVLFHVIFLGDMPYDGFVSCVKAYYEAGQGYLGGGVVGGLIGQPLLFLIGKAGTLLVLITLLVLAAVLLGRFSLVSLVKDLMERFSEWREERALRREEEMYEDDDYDDEDEEYLDEDYEEEEEFEKPKRSRKIIDFPIFHKEETEPEEPEQLSIPTDEPTGIRIVDHEDEVPENDMPLEPLPLEALPEEPLTEEAEAPRADEDPSDTTIEIPKETIHIPYKKPPLSLLQADKPVKQVRQSAKDLEESGKNLESLLESFGVEAKVLQIERGPAVTRYELQPGKGVKVNRIVSLQNDLALYFASSGIRIEAPIPGKAAVGIEVPNVSVGAVTIRRMLSSDAFIEHPSPVAFALGQDIAGKPVVADIAKMPHVLIAGATGSGKSVCINSMITSLLYKSDPNEVKLLMVDPKVVELSVYNGIPHLLIPVVTDPRKAAGALNWAVQEMVQRYQTFADCHVRDMAGYNKMVEETGEGEKMPQIVIIIDELADLMMVAPHDVEDAICRLAQMARAAGMHLVIATQRPSVDVITGIIKANIPSRISFAVSSQIDSRTILDMAGAEKLMGKGDMLFYPVGASKPQRLQGAYISDKEVEAVVNFVKKQGNEAKYDEDILEKIETVGGGGEKADAGDNDDLLPQAIEIAVDIGQISTSLLQRRLKVGYARAGRIIDQMEERGIISGFEGSKPRKTLISREEWQEMLMNQEG